MWWNLPIYLGGCLGGAAVLGQQHGQASPDDDVAVTAAASDTPSTTMTTMTTTTTTTTQTASAPPPPAFTYDRNSFLLHGEPYVIIGGQIDPQRIPRAYWRDRLARARAMGLNTVFAYVFWNLLEPEPGLWTMPDDRPPEDENENDDDDDDDDDDGSILSNDIAAYVRIAGEEGLRVVLRPGPYACGERDWGGLPYWLSTVPGMRVRADNAAFLAAARAYLGRLAGALVGGGLLAAQGGPLLMVQVENEYGSYGADHAYTAAVRDILREAFAGGGGSGGVPLYTNDGGVAWALGGGSVPGALAAVDGGDPAAAFAARDRYVTDPSSLGPLLDGEYYAVWADVWGAGERHNTAEGDAARAARAAADVAAVLAANNSLSVYMFHGGTNFGFGSGALRREDGGGGGGSGGATAAFTTSYDYGAPLDESGRATGLFRALRDAIAAHAPPGISSSRIPEPPADVPLLGVGEFALEPAVSLFDAGVLAEARRIMKETKMTSEAGDGAAAAAAADDDDQGGEAATSPLTMEELGQAYGFVLYEHRVAAAAAAGALEGVLRPGDRARDRVLVYVNDERAGVIDSTYGQRAAEVRVSLAPGDMLRLLVENLGRVDYWSRESGEDAYNGLEDPFKGIRGDVTVGGAVVRGWRMYSLPLTSPPPSSPLSPPPGGSTPSATAAVVPAVAPAAGSPPFFYRGSFEVPAASNATSSDPATLDTFLAVPGGVKGVVWVNGFNLGKYWAIGPQQSLYLPGVLLRGPGEGPNDVVVLELEPVGPGVLTALGSAERSWGNRPDPDYP